MIYLHLGRVEASLKCQHMCEAHCIGKTYSDRKYECLRQSVSLTWGKARRGEASLGHHVLNIPRVPHELLQILRMFRYQVEKDLEKLSGHVKSP